MSDEFFDPDPYRMGLMPDLRCDSCGRDRYSECVRTLNANVVFCGDGCIEIKSAPCTCGVTRIKLGWLPPGPDDIEI